MLVCLNGQIASANALSLHATVVVYGPIKKKGKSMQMTATKILVAGSPRVAMQTNAALYSNNSMSKGQSLSAGQSNSSNGSVAATDAWNADSQGGSNTTITGSSGGSGLTTSQDNWQASNTGSSKSQNSGGISCNALQFDVSSQDAATGMGKGRFTASAITCRMQVGQPAMQPMEYAATCRRLGNVVLNWQGQISAALMNAVVSSVQFTSDSGNQVVDVTFAFQRAEITHLGSGTRVTF